MTYEEITNCIDLLAAELVRTKEEVAKMQERLSEAKREIEAAKLSCEALTKPVVLRNFSAESLAAALHENLNGNGKR